MGSSFSGLEPRVLSAGERKVAGGLMETSKILVNQDWLFLEGLK